MARVSSVALALAVAALALASTATGAVVGRSRVALRAPAARAVSMVVVGKNEANLKKKADTVDVVKARLDTSSLIFTFRADGLEVNDLRKLRDELPEGCSVSLVKNRLLKRAIEGNPKWDHIDELLHYSNYWTFVHEDQMKAAIDAVQKFLKATGRLDKDHPLGDKADVRGGCFDGEPLDLDGIIKVSKLPTKLELITQIAVGINMVPARLGRAINKAGDATPIARGIKQVPTKLGRGIKLAKGEE
mmetsp:Transcript_13749/g.46466  ORF Transcript_13749/g.46466 Transcript_13749/m.46466 type:complete len:246 (+) Transcript_13749:31-768(+)